MNGPRLVLSVGALILLCGASPPQARAADEPPGTRSFDVNDCKTCHEAAVTKFQQTHHGGLAQSCASCHGDVTAHLQSNIEKGVPGPIVSFKKMAPADINKQCLTCHDKGHQANWAGGMHERRGLSCTSCHSVHDFKSD